MALMLFGGGSSLGSWGVTSGYVWGSGELWKWRDLHPSLTKTRWDGIHMQPIIPHSPQTLPSRSVGRSCGFKFHTSDVQQNSQPSVWFSLQTLCCCCHFSSTRRSTAASNLFALAALRARTHVSSGLKETCVTPSTLCSCIYMFL